MSNLTTVRDFNTLASDIHDYRDVITGTASVHVFGRLIEHGGIVHVEPVAEVRTALAGPVPEAPDSIYGMPGVSYTGMLSVADAYARAEAASKEMARAQQFYQ